MRSVHVTGTVLLLLLGTLPADASRRDSAAATLQTNTSDDGPFKEYCEQQQGEYFSKPGGGGESCLCRPGKGLACWKDGAYGCGPSRSLNYFSPNEIAVCKEDPCKARDGVMEPGPGKDKTWRCACKGEKTGSYCHSLQQPCPVVDGLDSRVEFLPSCESCNCILSGAAPKINKKALVKSLCKSSGGTSFGGTCMCNAGDTPDGVCLGLHGKIGCPNVHDWSEKDCRTNADGGLDCPTCAPNPCTRDNKNAKVSPKRTLWNGFPEQHDEGYVCECVKDETAPAQEQMLCYEGSEPGCPDSIAEGLRWQHGFEASCEECMCLVTISYEHSAWKDDAKRQKGNRFILPSENLCDSRGPGAHFDHAVSEQAGAVRCSCLAGSVCQGQCDAESFDPFGESHCVEACSKPDIPDNALIQNDNEMWKKGEAIRWDCELGYSMQGAPSTECLSGGKWSNPPPHCVETVPCPSTCGSCLPPSQRLTRQNVCASCPNCYYGLHANKCIKRKTLLLGTWKSEGRQYQFTDAGEKQVQVQVFKVNAKGEAVPRNTGDLLNCSPSSAENCNVHLCSGQYTYKHKKTFGAKESAVKLQIKVIGGFDEQLEIHGEEHFQGHQEQTKFVLAKA